MKNGKYFNIFNIYLYYLSINKRLRSSESAATLKHRAAFDTCISIQQNANTSVNIEGQRAK